MFQPGMAQARPNVAPIPTPNSQTLQNMQIQFQQQMSAVLQQQQQQQQQQQMMMMIQQQQGPPHGGQVGTQISTGQSAVTQPWALQASVMPQQGGYQSSADAQQLRRIGPGGSLGNPGQLLSQTATVSSVFIATRSYVLLLMKHPVNVFCEFGPACASICLSSAS